LVEWHCDDTEVYEAMGCAAVIWRGSNVGDGEYVAVRKQYVLAMKYG